MKLHLLLTEDVAISRPESCKIIMDFGFLRVVFEACVKYGKHCVVEASEEELINWLKPFDAVIVGDGNPMMERFSIMHIKDILV